MMPDPQYPVPPWMFGAVQNVESGGNPNAVSPAGAMGPMQVMPQTAADPGFGVMPARDNSPQELQRVGNDYLGAMMNRYHGNQQQALQAYNWGPGNVDKLLAGKIQPSQIPAETQAYVPKVMGQQPQGVSQAYPPEMQYAQNNMQMNDASPSGGTMDVTLPNGMVIAGVPVGISKDELRQKLTAKGIDIGEAPPQQSSFLGEMGQNFMGGIHNLEDLATGNYEQGLDPTMTGPKEQSLESKMFPPGYAGGMMETLKNVGNTNLSDWSGAMNENISHTPEAKILGAMGGILPLWNAAGTANNRYISPAIHELTGINPENLQLLETALPAATYMAGKMMPSETQPKSGIIGQAGQAIQEGGEARAANAKTSFVQDLITPKQTPTVQADQFSRATEQGLLRSRKVEPTTQEAASIDVVSQLPVSSSKSMLANYNIISDANDAKARTLQSRLETVNVPIKLGELNNSLETAMDNLRKNPWITGDGEKSAEAVMDGFKNIVIKNDDMTASGLLQARKDFDSWVKTQKGAGVFDPTRDSPITMAVQTIRRSVNDLIAAKVPDVAVKKSLAEQSALYRAMDNIETKGGQEAPTAIGRLKQKLSSDIPGKGIVKGVIGLAGASGAALHPYIAAGLGATYLAQKGLRSPLTQQAIGRGIKAQDMPSYMFPFAGAAQPTGHSKYPPAGFQK